MGNLKNKIESVDIKTVIPNKDNPRILKDDKFKKLVKSIKEFPQMMEIRPIVVNSDMVVLGGNMRLEACKKANLKKVTIIKADNLTEEQQKEFIIKDNVGFGEWDWDMLANEWDVEKVQDWGLDLPIWDNDEEQQDEDNEYTNKIETPIYETKDDKPNTQDLVDRIKAEDLISKIEKADLSEIDKDFLKLAAFRHLVFDYSKIADFYAHSTEDVQKLMEDSALVVIDFDKAIENGYVKLSEQIGEEYTKENDYQ